MGFHEPEVPDLERIGDTLGRFCSQLSYHLDQQDKPGTPRSCALVLREVQEFLNESGLPDQASFFEETWNAPLPHDPTELAHVIAAAQEHVQTIRSMIRSHPDRYIKKIQENRQRAWDADRTVSEAAFVGLDKIEALEQLQPQLTGTWDLSALIELCKAINVNHANQHYLPVAMMLRAVMDHVPPIYDGQKNFESVIAQTLHPKYDRSEKEAYEAMYDARPIMNFLTHKRISDTISMPGPEVVDIKTHFNFMLDRVIERLRRARSFTS